MGVAALGGTAAAQSFDFKPNQRYPDASVQILDPSFGKYRIFSSTVEQVATGMRWAEGPVWFGDGRYLLVSDIPNNRIMRFDEATGAWGVFRSPSNFSNGMARDRQGRLLVCEHLGRRVTRTEYDGRITVIADKFNGKRLNSPNDIVCQVRRLDLVHRPAVRHRRQLGRRQGRRPSCRTRCTACRPTARSRW